MTFTPRASVSSLHEDRPAQEQAGRRPGDGRGWKGFSQAPHIACPAGPLVTSSGGDTCHLSLSLAPCASCPDPRSIHTARDGKGAPLKQVCSPQSHQRRLARVPEEQRAPSLSPPQGLGAGPPVTAEEPPCPLSGPCTAATLPQALFSLCLWVSGIFLHAFPDSVG